MERFFYYFETFLKKEITRRKFLKFMFGGVLLFVSENKFLKMAFAKSEESTGRPKKRLKGLHDIVLAEGGDPYQNTVKAVEAMGGMEKFVKKNSVVVVKPNMGWDRNPAQAANTDPQVVAALVELSYKAGAKRVNIFDIPCNDERRVHENSGIAKAAKEKGAHVYYVDNWNVVKAKFSYKSPMEGWPILRDAIDCDTFINVPVLKSHGLTTLTLSMKNLMGVCSGQRGLMHMTMGPSLVDTTDFINPELTVIDATRFLAKNGPSGGNVEDVVTLNKVIVATDPTLADTFASTLVKINPMSISYIQEAARRGFGSTDIQGAKIQLLKVG